MISQRNMRNSISVLFICGVALASSATAQDTPDAQQAVEELQNVVKAMQQSSRDLRTKAVSKQTVKTQQDAVAGLDRLIALASKLETRQPSETPAPPPAQPNSENKEKPNTGQKNGAQQSNEQRNKDNEPQDSTDTTSGSQKSSQAPGGSRKVILQQAWGHLPPAIRKRLMSTSDEKPIPRYRRLVERYFQAIAEQNKPRKQSPTSQK